MQENENLPPKYSVVESHQKPLYRIERFVSADRPSDAPEPPRYFRRRA